MSLHRQTWQDSIWGKVVNVFVSCTSLVLLISQSLPQIQLYETFHTDTKIYLVMEYASGGDLLDYINLRSRRGIGVGEELAKRLFRQLAEGVAHCHRRNVVHRLDKPYSHFDT